MTGMVGTTPSPISGLAGADLSGLVRKMVGADARKPWAKPVLVERDPLDPVSLRAVINDLRKLIGDAVPAIRLVESIATLTDTECDFEELAQFRHHARCTLRGQAFTRAPMYGEEERQRAAAAMAIDRPGSNVERCLELVDRVAGALGMRRAGI